MTSGWKLDRDQRERLLVAHPPKYPNVVADHVTLSITTPEPPADFGKALIIGLADDGTGVQALVVEIDGSTSRPDGKTWHITWSLADGRAARESNDVIARQGWLKLASEEIVIRPAVW